MIVDAISCLDLNAVALSARCLLGISSENQGRLQLILTGGGQLKSMKGTYRTLRSFKVWRFPVGSPCPGCPVNGTGPPIHWHSLLGYLGHPGFRFSSSVRQIQSTLFAVVAFSSLQHFPTRLFCAVPAFSETSSHIQSSFEFSDRYQKISSSSFTDINNPFF